MILIPLLDMSAYSVDKSSFQAHVGVPRNAQLCGCRGRYCDILANSERLTPLLRFRRWLLVSLIDSKTLPIRLSFPFETIRHLLSGFPMHGENDVQSSLVQPREIIKSICC